MPNARGRNAAICLALIRELSISGTHVSLSRRMSLGSGSSCKNRTGLRDEIASKFYSAHQLPIIFQLRPNKCWWKLAKERFSSGSRSDLKMRSLCACCSMVAFWTTRYLFLCRSLQGAVTSVLVCSSNRFHVPFRDQTNQIFHPPLVDKLASVVFGKGRWVRVIPSAQCWCINTEGVEGLFGEKISNEC